MQQASSSQRCWLKKNHSANNKPEWCSLAPNSQKMGHGLLSNLATWAKKTPTGYFCKSAPDVAFVGIEVGASFSVDTVGDAPFS